MKHTSTANDPAFESTYALLMRSEETRRSASETAVYALLILSVIFSIWQTAYQPVTVPTNLLIRTAAVSKPVANRTT